MSIAKNRCQANGGELDATTLPKTNSNIFAPENGCFFQEYSFPFGGKLGLFSGAYLLLVSGRVIDP